MKLNIIFDNIVLSTTISKGIKIKDLIASLKESSALSTDLQNENSIFQLIDEKYTFAGEDEILQPQENHEKTFHLISSRVKLCQQSEPRLELDQAITKVTGGKTNLPKNNKKNPSSSVDSRLQMLEQIANNFSQFQNMNHIPGLQNRVNEINNLTNILRSMISDDLVNIDFQSRPSRPAQQQNVIPDQNMLNQLKDMGFPEDQCRRALVMSRNNISRATDILINDELDYINK
jgi:uncharacterized UBP type Zn finger protein